MNKKFGFFRILVMVLVFGMTIVGYVHGQANSGTFTLTDIPAKYNGKYAMLMNVNEGLFGLQSINLTGTSTLVRIANGRVVLPMWILTPNGFIRYSGNDSNFITIRIFEKPSITILEIENKIVEIDFDDVAFSNGSARKSINDGDLYEW